jgi:hypothetical protein
MESIKTYNPRVNKSTGLHVHLCPTTSNGWTTQQLKALAHNFVQLESAMDQLVPHSRRSDTNSYCRSNLTALTQNGGRSKQDALRAINMTTSTTHLKYLVCPGGRYFKLNLWALDRHGTVEIRHT